MAQSLRDPQTLTLLKEEKLEGGGSYLLFRYHNTLTPMWAVSFVSNHRGHPGWGVGLDSREPKWEFGARTTTYPPDPWKSSSGRQNLERNWTKGRIWNAWKDTVLCTNNGIAVLRVEYYANPFGHIAALVSMCTCVRETPVDH